MMKEEGEGLWGVVSGSESIRSTASALRRVNGGGCKWCLRTCVPSSSCAPWYPGPASPRVSQHEGRRSLAASPFLRPVSQCPWPLSALCSFSPCVTLTEQRRSGNEPRLPTPHPNVRTGYKRGEVIAVTSEVWALAQDSNQPETHKDQSTSERRCHPGPQAKPVGKGLPHAVIGSGRSRPDPAEDLARPSQHQRARRLSPSLCIPSEHLILTST
ncbi:unnamed protein product [Pipistrellus nathusii]|uniref:Uncharacterized protein n=1 Tax=Pipistrellus nathusii TaxID=59473 RepID=A0ABN9ZTQ6_PIPNA